MPVRTAGSRLMSLNAWRDCWIQNLIVVACPQLDKRVIRRVSADPRLYPPLIVEDGVSLLEKCDKLYIESSSSSRKISAHALAVGRSAASVFQQDCTSDRRLSGRSSS